MAARRRAPETPICRRAASDARRSRLVTVPSDRPLRRRASGLRFAPFARRPAAEVPREHAVSTRPDRSAGTLRAPGGQVDVAPRRAVRRDVRRARPCHGLPRGRRHVLDAERACARCGALVEEGADRGTLTIRGPGLRAAGRGAHRRRQRRHADAARARLAGRPARRRVVVRRRRVDPPPARRPRRDPAARDGRVDRRAPTAASPRSPCTACRCAGSSTTLPVASAQVKSCVLMAGLLASRARRR